MKTIVLRLLPLVCLSICSCGFFLARFADKMVNQIGDLVNETAEIAYVTDRFKDEYHRWPTSQAELIEFTSAQGIPFDWSRFSHGTFKPQEDGSVEILFLHAPPKKGVVSTVIGGKHKSPTTRVELGAKELSISLDN